MKLLTHQSVKHVVEGDSDDSEAQPWEEPASEKEPEQEKSQEVSIDCVQLVVRLEGSSCIRLDSLGGGKIQVAFSDEEGLSAFELGKWRGKNLIATFMLAPSSLKHKAGK